MTAVSADNASYYNHWLVGLSVAVAVLVSYTALSLAARVAAAGARYVHAWLIGGALAMASASGRCISSA